RGGVVWVSVAFVIGAMATWGLAHVLPSDDTPVGDEPAGRATMLIVAAVALHSIPEGMAVGIGVGHDPDGSGLALAGGIMMQNLPEGLAVAVALAALGASHRQA